MKRPSALVFDLGDTLLHSVSFEVLKGVKKILSLETSQRKPSQPEVLSFLRKMREFIEPGSDVQIVECPVQTIIKIVSHRFDFDFSHTWEELELEFWKEACHMEPEPGVKEVLSSLEKEGFPLAVVSNSALSSSTLRWELDRHNLGHHFQFVLSSADYALRKPHPALFEVAAAKLSLPAGELWYTGDSWPSDVKGSRGVGMTPIWYNTNGKEVKREFEVTEVKNWQDFYTLIESVL